MNKNIGVEKKPIETKDAEIQTEQRATTLDEEETYDRQRVTSKDVEMNSNSPKGETARLLP